jgi:hypothetical protein
MILSDRRQLLRPPLNCRGSGFVQSSKSHDFRDLVLAATVTRDALAPPFGPVPRCGSSATMGLQQKRIPHMAVTHPLDGRALSCSPSTCWRLDGLDMRREPIETRKATLASLLRKSRLLLDYPWGLCAFRGDCRAVRAALSQLAALEDCPAAGFGAGVIRGHVSLGGVPLAARSFGHGRNSHIRRRNGRSPRQRL